MRTLFEYSLMRIYLLLSGNSLHKLPFTRQFGLAHNRLSKKCVEFVEMNSAGGILSASSARGRGADSQSSAPDPA